MPQSTALALGDSIVVKRKDWMTAQAAISSFTFRSVHQVKGAGRANKINRHLYIST
jgi:hypothetical protein